MSGTIAQDARSRHSFDRALLRVVSRTGPPSEAYIRCVRTIRRFLACCTAFTVKRGSVGRDYEATIQGEGSPWDVSGPPFGLRVRPWSANFEHGADILSRSKEPRIKHR